MGQAPLNTTLMDPRDRFKNLYFLPGDIIAERYEFIRELGHGGMGMVFLCRDTVADGREMAVKTVPDILRNDKEAVAAMRHEYDNMYALTHDGIVAVRNLVQDEFRYYIVMDYAKGETLDVYLKAHPQPDVAVTLEVIRRLAAALDYAHGKGLVHRDVKPGNVMVQIDGETVRSVKLLDFGLGMRIRQSFSQTTGQLTSGTPAYKSPEQWSPHQFGKPSAKSDQYSLAAIAYEMLVGHYPFEDYDLETFRDGVLNDLPEAIDGVSNEVNNALQKALAKMPEDRFGTCTAFAEAMEGLGNQDINHIPYSVFAPRVSMKEETLPSIPLADPPEKGNLTFELAKGVVLDMIWIPPGTFMMGSPKDEYGRNDNERQHQVTLSKGFWMGKYPVTQEQYKTVTGMNPSKFTGWFFMKNDHPVEYVTWNEALAYCDKLNKIHRKNLPAGYEFCLPTEAQWEYACRAGTDTPLNQWIKMKLEDRTLEQNMDDVGWFRGNSADKTHPVGQKKPNAWGLYDMHGNVCEWCLDWYEAGYAKDPEFLQGNSGSNRVLRGGAWGYSAGYCRSACRSCSEPELRRSFCNLFGFRVALSSVSVH